MSWSSRDKEDAVELVVDAGQCCQSVAGMPSQLFDDGYGVYEIPSGDRLTFKGGEGADASYNLPSSFDKASSPQRGRSAGMGSADRFNAPGSYLAHAGAPGTTRCSICIHAIIHANMEIYMYVCIQTYTHKCVCLCVDKCTVTLLHSYIHILLQDQARTRRAHPRPSRRHVTECWDPSCSDRWTASNLKGLARVPTRCTVQRAILKQPRPGRAAGLAHPSVLERSIHMLRAHTRTRPARAHTRVHLESGATYMV